MRRTYHYDEATKQMVEGPAPRKGSSGDGWRFSDRIYSGTPFKAHDGTVIDSRAKHRAYMKRHSLTTMDDYTNQWKGDEQRRAEFFAGKHDRAERANQIAHAIAKLKGD